MVSPDYINRNGIACWKENSIPTSSDNLMQFTGLKDKYKALTHEGNSFPSNASTGNGKRKFDYGNSYSFPFASLEDAVSDEAVGNFASFIVEFLTIRAKMLELLKKK